MQLLLMQFGVADAVVADVEVDDAVVADTDVAGVVCSC